MKTKTQLTIDQMIADIWSLGCYLDMMSFSYGVKDAMKIEVTCYQLDSNELIVSTDQSSGFYPTLESAVTSIHMYLSANLSQFNENSTKYYL